MNLRNCGGNNLEVSSVSWLPIVFLRISSASKVDRVNNSNVKVWNKSMQWLRHKCLKVAGQWRWQHEKKVDRFSMKTDDNEHDEYVSDESKLRLKVHRHDWKKEQLGLNFYGTIGTFKNGVLRIIDKDKAFISDDAIAEEVKRSNDEIIQSIKNKEANEATDALQKD